MLDVEEETEVPPDSIVVLSIRGFDIFFRSGRFKSFVLLHLEQSWTPVILLALLPFPAS